MKLETKSSMIVAAVALVFFLLGFYIAPNAGVEKSPAAATQCPPCGKETPDFSKCRNLTTGESDWCVFREAYESRNWDYCNYIYSLGIKNYCYGVTLNDKEYCNKVQSPDLQKQCHDVVAAQLGQ